MSIYALFEQTAAKAQWTAEQQTEILLQYIERQRSNDAFADYLAEESGSAEENESADGAGQTLIVHGDGTVTDTATGLMWMRPLLGQSIDDEGNVVGNPQKISFDDAAKAASTATFAGYHDWRVPTIDEMEMLNMVDQNIWGGENRHLWSSDLYALDTDLGWCLYVEAGVSYVHPRSTTNLQVRLVRTVA